MPGVFLTFIQEYQCKSQVLLLVNAPPAYRWEVSVPKALHNLRHRAGCESAFSFPIIQALLASTHTLL